MFCRIQNLHISQTTHIFVVKTTLFCRIQNLHISQTKQVINFIISLFCRIQNLHISQTSVGQCRTKTCFVEFKIYISLKRNVEFDIDKRVLQNSKFTYLSNYDAATLKACMFCRIQNLHISQTQLLLSTYLLSFVEFKIYISLKQCVR